MLNRLGGRRRRRGERGVALVEFAIVAPLLAVVVFGVIDVGRAYKTQAQLRNAAREGAAFGRNYPSNVEGCASGGSIKDVTIAEDTDASPDFEVHVYNASGTELAACTRTADTPDPGEDIVVETSTTFDVVTPLVGLFVGDPINMRARARAVVVG